MRSQFATSPTNTRETRTQNAFVCIFEDCPIRETSHAGQKPYTFGVRETAKPYPVAGHGILLQSGDASVSHSSGPQQHDHVPYHLYKLVHFFGIFVLLMTLAVPLLHFVRGGTRADFPRRRTLAIVHGVASFLILLGGFGMLARLGIVQEGLPGWILLKLGIWFVLSAALTVALRTRFAARTVILAAPLLALTAAAIALYKPL